MCSKLEGIFKHISLTPWTHAWSAMAFKFQNIKNRSETHETLLDDVPLGEFLDEQIARVRQHDIVKSDDELETEKLNTY